MKILNNKGVGLVEVTTSAFILSLLITAAIGALINLYAVSRENSEKFNISYFGPTVLNYLDKTDFTYYLTKVNESGYVKLDVSMCSDPTFAELNYVKVDAVGDVCILPEDPTPEEQAAYDACTYRDGEQEICETALNPMINNVTFDSDSLYFYIYPFSNQTVVDQMIADPTVDTNVKNYLQNDFQLSPIGDKSYILRVALVLKISERQTLLFNDSIYDESASTSSG